MIRNIVLAGIVLAISGCASLQSQHQKIAAACEGAASAADSISVAVTAGRLDKSAAQKAANIYRATVPFCQPEPAQSLSSVDYAALLAATAQMTVLSGSAK